MRIQELTENQGHCHCKKCRDSGKVCYDHDDHEVGATVKASAPCPECSIEEADTKLDLDFDPANYKSVIKHLQNKEISGKKKAAFLKSRIMRRLKSGGKVSRKEVLGMIDSIV